MLKSCTGILRWWKRSGFRCFAASSDDAWTGVVGPPPPPLPSSCAGPPDMQLRRVTYCTNYVACETNQKPETTSREITLVLTMLAM
eukprot:5617463-Amphidinium_carterae.1